MIQLLRLLAMQVALTQQAFYGLVLGIVQGISEWLPISSKTQILVVSQYILGMGFNQAYAFGLFMEIGTIFAAVIYFRKEVVILFRTLFRKDRREESIKLFNYVLVSTIATGIIGAPLYLFVDSLQGAYSVAIPMIIIGAVLIGDALLIHYSRSKYRNDSKRKTLKDLRFRDYAIVGIAQGLAALPGVSRSGATTSTLLVMNVEAGEAFRLSFIDMILATGGAVALTLVASRHSISSSIGLVGGYGIIIAIVAATAISLLLIDFLLKIAKKSSIVYLVSALGIIAIAGGLIAVLL